MPMSRAPHPPAALHPRAVVPRVALGVALLIVPLSGCYQGPPDPDGEAWDGVLDEDTDGGDGDGGAADGGAADGGAADGGAADGADDGPPPPGDGGADPTDGGTDPSGDDGGADDGAADGGAADGGDGGPATADVPDNAYCMDVAQWEPQWAQLEQEILAIVNEVRAQGANCGSEGSFGPTQPLTMQPNLRCAARVHSKDMADRSFFDHTNPSGESPWDRMGQAGYSYSAAGENIAGGNGTAAATMDQWMNSDGHCANIMSPNFTEIGVGYYPGGQWGHLWTQAFGSP